MNPSKFERVNANENVEAGGSVVCRGEMAWVIMLQSTVVADGTPEIADERFW